MTHFRTVVSIRSDMDRKISGTGPIGRRNELLTFLSDDPMGDATTNLTGSGPILFNLGVLNEPEWEGVRAFLGNTTLVSPQGQTELGQLESDLKSADANKDGFLNNPEIIAFAQTHSDRWPNVAIFRVAADSYLNRLPAYVAQPNMTSDDVSRLWGIINHFAKRWQDSDVPQEHWGSLYHLSLTGFPSTDTNNPPDLIRRAVTGELTPEELSVVHRLLETEQSPNGKYVFEGDSPLSPEEIGMLGQLVDNAAQKGRPIYGMTVVTGDAEKEAFAARDQAIQKCMGDITSAQAGASERGLAGAVGDCNAAMAPIEADHPERISATTLTTRAFMGELTPGEVSALRVWMKGEARSQGLTCDGKWDCMKMGAIAFFKGIARDPGHFIARNGAFITGAYLYRRFVLQNTVANRLNAICGGPVANPRQAYRDYEKFVRGELKKKGFWKRLPQSFLQNPYVGLAVFNFGIAPLKDTGNLAIDILTDQLLIPFTFEAFETWNAFRNQRMIGRFAGENPGICKPATQTAAELAPAPQEIEAEESMVITEEAAQFSLFSPATAEDAIKARFPEMATLSEGALIYRYQATIDGVLVGLPTEGDARSLAATRGIAFDPESFFFAGEFTADAFAAAMSGIGQDSLTSAGLDPAQFETASSLNAYGVETAPSAPRLSLRGTAGIRVGTPGVFAAPVLVAPPIVATPPVVVPMAAPVLVPL